MNAKTGEILDPKLNDSLRNASDPKILDTILAKYNLWRIWYFIILISKYIYIYKYVFINYSYI